MAREYSKVRLLLFFALIVLLFIPICLSFYNRIIHLIFSPFILFFVGTILFALNKKWTDYISFAIFTFGLIGSITIFISNWKIHVYESAYIYWYLMNNKLEIVFIIISSLVLTYLSKRTELFYKCFSMLPTIYRRNKTKAPSNIYKIIWSHYLISNFFRIKNIK
jgi:hypothetical protein